MNDWFLIDTLRLFGFIAAIIFIWIATGYLRLRGIFRPGDARKINHIVVLVGGSLSFGWLTPEKARVSGAIVGAVLLALVFLTCKFSDRKPFSWVFAGNTRPADAPREAYYFWSSWLLSFLALVGIEMIFWDPAITRASAIVVGVGDGFAEPIGSRFGRHIYKIPGFRPGRTLTRSLEGSLAVALGAFLSIVLLMIYTTDFGSVRLFTTATSIGLGAAVVEAVTPHGFDNLTVAVTVAGLFASMNCLF